MMLRRHWFLLLALLIGFLAPSPRAWPQGVGFPRTSPESQGVSSAQIVRFLKAADERIQSMHSFMMLRRGNVIAEAWWAPESADKPHVLWSLSKSFTSTAIGLAVAEGLIDIDDLVVKHFPESMPENPSAELKAMRIRDLLTMSTGHQNEPKVRDKTDWIREFLAHPVVQQPGTRFVYNTPATFMQSAILQKVTGKTTLEYLQPRLFGPLGIESPQWDTNPQGITLGGYGLFLRTEDIAKFGQLYLQRGRWNGQQLVPESWIDAATSKQISNGANPESDWNQGYGFQFWRCRHNAYRGDGKDGQFCVVMPDEEIVIVMTAKNSKLQDQLNVVWDELLPGVSAQPIAPNPAAESELKQFAATLATGEHRK
ncbi:MAG: serine hydrolase domain-containing protein [Planctomycetota bacterium]